MSLENIKEDLANRWLNTIPAFSRQLVDTGERYNGCPVFVIQYRFDKVIENVRVFRYTPVNSVHSYLQFVPE
jgi:hypothetical protein